MRELNLEEIRTVSGSVSQSTAIGTNMGIIGFGVAITLAAGMTAPMWFPLGMMAVSVGVTTAYLTEEDS